MAENVIVTGNEMISLPSIRPEDGGINEFTFLHMGYKGMIDVRGTKEEPLLRPFVEVDGQRACLADFTWEKDLYWIPCFSAKAGDFEVSGTILAPIGERGFAYRLTIRGKRRDGKIRLGFEGIWGETLHCINESKPMCAQRFVYESGWNHGLVFDMRVGVSVFSFAPMFSHDVQSAFSFEENGDIRFSFFCDMAPEPDGAATLDCFLGLGFEEVGAATAAKEMLRRGFDSEHKKTRQWLENRKKTVGDARLDTVLNENLFFNFFFASGKTLDTEELVLVTSRSPRYYVSAAYWDRDSLLWSFPSILLADAAYARQMLRYVFSRQRMNLGVHSRYIDGTVLEPGFELDELCAPVIALADYVRTTGDGEVLRAPDIAEGVAVILSRLGEHRHPCVALYETFLQPTDDVSQYPYLTYDNVLVWKTYTALAELYQGQWSPEMLGRLRDEAEQVRKAVYEHCVIGTGDAAMFAWSVDLNGNRSVYDEPPGSLQLLPYYGFCGVEDEIYANTCRMIRRPEYKYSFSGFPIDEIGCDHAPHPWILSLANSLLCGRADHCKRILGLLKMDNGIACESVDENTGESATGDAFATCAGFLSFAIYQSFHK